MNSQNANSNNVAVYNTTQNRRGSVGTIQHQNHMFQTMAKNRRGSIGATQFHMALRQLLDAMKFHRHLFGVEVSTIDTLFDAIDTESTGFINKYSLGDALHRLGVGLNNEQVDVLVHAMNADANGKISYRNFQRTLNTELSMLHRKGGGRQQHHDSCTVVDCVRYTP